jgi:hypothetical protein
MNSTCGNSSSAGKCSNTSFSREPLCWSSTNRIQPDGKTKKFKVTYKLDFWVRYADNRTEYVEVKGPKRVRTKIRQGSRDLFFHAGLDYETEDVRSTVPRRDVLPGVSS